MLNISPTEQQNQYGRGHLSPVGRVSLPVSLTFCLLSFLHQAVMLCRLLPDLSLAANVLPSSASLVLLHPFPPAQVPDPQPLSLLASAFITKVPLPQLAAPPPPPPRCSGSQVDRCQTRPPRFRT